MQVLLIGSDRDELTILSQALQQASLKVLATSNITEALAQWKDVPADLIILSLPAHAVDEPIPYIDELRGITEVPLVLLTDPLREDEHIAVLDAGADLVFFRPYSARLLVSQIPALLRRTSGVPLTTLPPLHKRGVQLEPTSRLVSIPGQSPRQLSHLEFRLLYTLMAQPDEPIPVADLVERVWGPDSNEGREAVRKLVRRLRQKVEPNPAQPRYVRSASGLGYFYHSKDQ